MCCFLCVERLKQVSWVIKQNRVWKNEKFSACLMADFNFVVVFIVFKFVFKKKPDGKFWQKKSESEQIGEKQACKSKNST